jgi:hypothetical protein
MKIELNENFGKIENLFNKIPALSSPLNNSILYYDYNIDRDIETYD